MGDGSEVPQVMVDDAAIFTWDAGYPVDTITESCLAFIGGKLRNIDCENGYFDGTTGSNYLGYLCEARPMENLDKSVCYFPFVYQDEIYDSCSHEYITGTVFCLRALNTRKKELEESRSKFFLLFIEPF